MLRLARKVQGEQRTFKCTYLLVHEVTLPSSLEKTWIAAQGSQSKLPDAFVLSAVRRETDTTSQVDA